MTKSSLERNKVTAYHNKAWNVKGWLRIQCITQPRIFIRFLTVIHIIGTEISHNMPVDWIKSFECLQWVRCKGKVSTFLHVVCFLNFIVQWNGALFELCMFWYMSPLAVLKPGLTQTKFTLGLSKLKKLCTVLQSTASKAICTSHGYNMKTIPFVFKWFVLTL